MKVTAEELQEYQEHMAKERDLTEAIQTGYRKPTDEDLNNVYRRVEFMQRFKKKYNLDWYGSYRIAEDGTIEIQRGKGLWFQLEAQS